VKGSLIIPDEGQAYLDRSVKKPGMLVSGAVAVEAFKSIGWKWGGDWTRPKDYMHFSSTGR
jgi:hypothetical protein